MTYVLTPVRKDLQGAFRLEVHESLIAGLRRDGALTHNDVLNTNDVAMLLKWAQTCANPLGGKAAMAKAIAALVVVGEGARLLRREQPIVKLGLWEAAST